MEKILYKEESYKIIGICYEVHKTLGSGFLEIVYKDALTYEFMKAGIPFEREKKYVVIYKDCILPHHFYADFVLFDTIILEVKGVSGIAPECVAQAMNYLKVSRTHLKNRFEPVFSSIRTLTEALEEAHTSSVRAIQVTKDKVRRRRKDAKDIFEMSSKNKLALIVNFGELKLSYKRVVL